MRDIREETTAAKNNSEQHGRPYRQLDRQYRDSVKVWCALRSRDGHDSKRSSNQEIQAPPAATISVINSPVRRRPPDIGAVDGAALQIPTSPLPEAEPPALGT
jgi:hypothetical protein